MPWFLAAILVVGVTACGGAQDAAVQAAVSSGSASATPSPGPGASPKPSPGPSRTPRRTPTPRPTSHPAVASGWVGPIYAPRLHGYDISYPQCPEAGAPPGARFSVIGVNAGKAFSVNPCLRAQWQAARGIRAVYFNSGYDSRNASRVYPDCLDRSLYQEGGPERQLAYAIGCSEAVFAVNTLVAAGAKQATMIWLDVESSNSWDPSKLDLNRTALQAEIDQLAAFGRLVGLYSTYAQWREIMGDWAPAGVVADWVAGRTPDQACGVPGFSGRPVWLAQELDTWAGVDSDWTC